MSTAIDCKQIITDYLKAHGFDGLSGDGCGCGLDNLCPCVEGGGNPLSCRPAYAVKSKCIDCRCHLECEAADEDENGEERTCYTDTKPREPEGRLFRSDVDDAGERPA